MKPRRFTFTIEHGKDRSEVENLSPEVRLDRARVMLAALGFRVIDMHEELRVPTKSKAPVKAVHHA